MSEGTWLDMTAYPAGDPDQAAPPELLDHLHELFQASVHDASERVDPQRWQAMLFVAVAPDQPADDSDAAAAGIEAAAAAGNEAADASVDAGHDADTIHDGDPHSGGPEQDTGAAHHGDPFDPAQDHDPYGHDPYGHGYDDHTFDDSGHADDDVHDPGN